ncbi:LuxR C-terminal-related transcriptional regulator [uncultured Pseudomonas sp.]|uniref:response regulator transcription factor n=1 Tax=uncultured Pseudomonas sp. TaxID=114707 RepID=UPI0025D7A077|nr:LuxR C-terminal-related transcriptional regulator [uncultured Pseudomonas sp.]
MTELHSDVWTIVIPWTEQFGMKPVTGKKSARTALTPREQDVLRLVRQGLNNREIAHFLGIGLYTAREHVSSLKQKTGVLSVTALHALSALSDAEWQGLMNLCEADISPTESAVLRHLCHGCSSKHIARLLDISPRTADKHRQHLLIKSGRHSTRQLVAWINDQYAMCGVAAARVGSETELADSKSAPWNRLTSNGHLESKE